MNRLDSDHLKNRLRQAGTYSKKVLGQHFLINEKVLHAVVFGLTCEKGSKIVEVGPGLGVLTEVLLGQEFKVTCFEYDPFMADIVEEDFPEAELIRGDVLRTFPTWNPGGEYSVAANIPYQITTPLIQMFLENENIQKPKEMVLLVQKEVAERICAPAKGKNRGFLSVLCQMLAECEMIMPRVPKDSFFPPPAVESAVLRMKIRPAGPEISVDKDKLLKFIRAGFSQKRKQFKHVLAGLLRVKPEQSVEILSKLGLEDTVRAQELTLKEWERIYLATRNIV